MDVKIYSEGKQPNKSIISLCERERESKKEKENILENAPSILFLHLPVLRA
jgi:hypothetical protein